MPGSEDTHPEVIYEASQRTRNDPKKPDSFFAGSSVASRWVLRVRVDMGPVGLIVSEQGRNITP